jgi:hypothetical protein
MPRTREDDVECGLTQTIGQGFIRFMLLLMKFEVWKMAIAALTAS